MSKSDEIEIAGGMTASELLEKKSSARMVAARINDGSLVDKDKLSQLLKAALSMAAVAANNNDVRHFCALMKVVQAQQKIEMSESAKEKGLPLRQDQHVHIHGTQPKRSQLADLLERLGVQEAAQSYLADERG